MDERDPTEISRIVEAPRKSKYAAKRYNEKVKLRANLLNALAVALIGAAFVFPVIRDANLVALLEPETWVWILTGGGLIGRRRDRWIACDQRTDHGLADLAPPGRTRVGILSAPLR